MLEPSSPHSSGDPTILLIAGKQGNFGRACLELAGRFHGFGLVDCADVAAAEAATQELAAAGRKVIVLALSAGGLPHLSAGSIERVQALASRTGAAMAILGITQDNATKIPLALSAGQSVRASNAPHNSGLRIVAADPGVTGYELRDLRFELGAGSHSRIEHDAKAPARALAIIDGSANDAVLLRIDGDCPVYLLSHLEGDTSPPQGRDPRCRVPFGLLAPFFLLVRDAGGRRGWQAPAPFANLTIDDPRLVEPYGCLSYPGLLAEMSRTPFHATIGFVPWNYDRNSPAVVELFRSHPTRLSLAVHGNNHEGYEFFRYEAKPGDSQRSAPFEKQVFNIHQGLARIRLFENQTKLTVDRVMVFPQAISPAPTLAVLREAGFWATANFSNVPLDASVPADPASALCSALTDWHGFPTLRRDYPHEYSDEAIAIDLFLGNPVLFMAHQDDFSDGIHSFTAHAERVNRRQPAIRWVSLGEISRQLHRVRWLDQGRCSVRMISGHAALTNPATTATRFEIALPRATASAGTRVTVNGAEQPWNLSEGEIRFDLTLPAGGSALIEVHEPASPPAPVPTKRAGFRKWRLRLIADIRDLVIARWSLGRRLSKWYYRDLRRPALKTGRGKRRIALLWDRSSEIPRLSPALLADLPPELR